MKRDYFIGTFLVLLMLATSCKPEGFDRGSKQISDENITFVDTTLVLNETNKCIEFLHNGNINEALAMLYSKKEDGDITPISDTEKKELEKRFLMFPILKYKLESFSFNNKEGNSVKYITEFFEKGEDNVPNTISLVFNPVEVDGTWYLTLKNKH